jgi:hypothetical protein
MSQRIVVVGPNLRDQSKGTFHVHAEGCADLRRSPNLRHEDQSFVIDCDTLTQMCDAVYPPEDFGCESGEYLYDFHVAPCVHLNA